ncbi:Predicted transcriptional regulators (HipB) [uncultured Mediterranean phage uvMED]|nr:Predicted transcriptional regulators (HipB) [uncultured Mediterranean phage uvMED]
MLYNQIIKHLKLRRQYLRIDATALAEKVGVADSLINKWESLKQIPNASNFLNWCNALQMNVALLEHKSMIGEYEPSPQCIDYIINNHGSEVNINYEKEKFTDHYKANGDVKADWDACFRNWIRRSIQFSNNRRQAQTRNNPYDSNAVQERRKRISDVASMGDQVSDGQRQNIRTIKYDR